METKPVSSKMYALIILFDMHTNFLDKAIVGISDEDAHNRLGTKANHVAWLTGSLVHERFELAKELGSEKKDAAYELFSNHKGILSDTDYPSLSAYKKDWDIISPVLRNLFMKVTDERLDQPFEMPGEKMSFFDLVTFMTYREANCIGQIALWRRLLGYEALKYM